jgi:hypothetical protein
MHELTRSDHLIPLYCNHRKSPLVSGISTARYQVDRKNNRDENRQRHRNLRRSGACQRNECRHHAAEREADVPGQASAAGADRGRKSLVEKDQHRRISAPNQDQSFSGDLVFMPSTIGCILSTVVIQRLEGWSNERVQFGQRR